MTRKFKWVLTQRALADLVEVLEYSTEQWGKPTAEKYLDDLESGLERIRQQPYLLQPQPLLVTRGAVHSRNRDIVQAEIDAQVGSVVSQVVQDKDADDCRTGHREKRLTSGQ